MQPEPRTGKGWSWVLSHSGFGPAVSNILLSTSQHRKTAFAGDHLLSPTTLRPLCAGCRERPAPSLLCRAGLEELLIPGCRGTGTLWDGDTLESEATCFPEQKLWQK